MYDKTVLYGGEQFEARHFFDVDSQQDGVDVYYSVNESYVGSIENIVIPDEEDLEAVEQFDEIVVAWLKMQDANYRLL